ncbi:single-stranded DNA-binding protein [Lactococcus allomyrinae]|nr:single-stranded DNA-binding protein [Lactococcus allomyrinae]
MNNTQLIGRTTKVIELQTSPAGKSYARFTIAVNRRFKNANGEREADFIPCIIFGQSAEIFSKYVQKGDLVGIDGELRTSNYTDKDGNKRFNMEVIVTAFDFLPSHNQNAQGNQSTQQGQQNPSAYQAPQANSGQASTYDDPFSGGTPMEINPEDLPF